MVTIGFRERIHLSLVTGRYLLGVRVYGVLSWEESMKDYYFSDVSF
jgi:hypothetical protein